MRQESGRSLIEMLGVLAVGGLVAFGAIKMYQTAKVRQQRFVAEQELKELVENARIIYSGRRNYAGISKSYLIKTGALKTETIGGYDFRVRPNDEGKTFSIILDNLNLGDCAYFAVKKFDWADGVAVNNLAVSGRIGTAAGAAKNKSAAGGGIVGGTASLCAESSMNKLEFTIR